MEDIQNSKKYLNKKEELILEESKKIINKIAEEFKPKETEIGQELLKGMEDLREQQK